MKKFFAILILFLMFSTQAMAAVPVSFSNTGGATLSNATADKQIKATKGSIISVLVTYIGVTIADKIEIKNSTDNSGTALITISAATANGSFQYTPTAPVDFTTAIYYDETKSGGNFLTTILYS
jgi:hypothetical protein